MDLRLMNQQKKKKKKNGSEDEHGFDLTVINRRDANRFANTRNTIKY